MPSYLLSLFSFDILLRRFLLIALFSRIFSLSPVFSFYSYSSVYFSFTSSSFSLFLFLLLLLHSFHLSYTWCTSPSIFSPSLATSHCTTFTYIPLTLVYLSHGRLICRDLLAPSCVLESHPILVCPSGNGTLSACLTTRCDCVCDYVFKSDCDRDQILLCVWVYVCVCMCMSVYACMCICMYVCMYACMYVCMYAFMYVCMYVCMYVRVSMCQREIKHLFVDSYSLRLTSSSLLIQSYSPILLLPHNNSFNIIIISIDRITASTKWISHQSL